MSFRSLPEPSLNEIRKICEHYEAKCSGQYSSLASRYVLELAKEIKSQVDGIETKLTKNDSMFSASRASNTSKKPRKRQGSWLEDMLASSTSRLDQDSTSRYWQKDGGTTEGFVCGPSRSSSRPQSAPYYPSQEIPPEQQIHQLTQMLLQKDSELQFVKDDAVKALEANRKQYKQNLEHEKSNLKCMKEVIESKHEEDLLKVRKEIDRVKNDAKLVIDFVRKRANKAIEAERANSEREKRSVEERFNQMEHKMVEAFNSRLQKAESAIKSILSEQRFVVKSKDRPLNVSDPVSRLEIIEKRDKACPPRNEESPTSTASDNSTCRDRGSEDSISTRSSIHSRDNCCLNNRTANESNSDIHDHESTDEDAIKKTNRNQWFQDRLDELDQWTDALTLAIQQDKIPSPLFYKKVETNTSASSLPIKLKKPTHQKDWRL